MAEEELNNDTITDDDVNALRILLHNVKGLSTVSSAPISQEETPES